MESIFIGIPTVVKYQPFLDSMEKFIPLVEKEHEVEVYTLAGKTLAVARNTIVSRFLKSDKDYLLFLDDDHSGHSIEMLNSLLDPLINNGRLVCAIKCYAREFPYYSNLLQYKGDELFDGNRKYSPIYDESGYLECDLVGFGMTLVSRETFKRISEPYFISKDNSKEDVYFCDKLVRSGSRPIGCFDYVLEHRGINKDNALELRNKGIEELLKIHPDMKVLVT